MDLVNMYSTGFLSARSRFGHQKLRHFQQCFLMCIIYAARKTLFSPISLHYVSIFSQLSKAYSKPFPTFFLERTSLGTSLLTISPDRIPKKVGGVTLDAIGRRLVQLFYYTNTGGFLCSLWKIGSATQAIFLLYLQLYPPPQETRESNTFSQNKKSVKQILIGQRVQESGKWKSEDGQCQHYRTVAVF